MIRLLCIGLGGMGLHDWSQAAKTGDFELVAGVDVNPKAKAHFEKETGSPTYNDIDEALAKVEADAALVSTPDQFHAPFSIQALEAGLDVICEKPMAETLEDARRMHRSATDNDRMLMIHHQLRWMPAHYHARRLICEGAIGQVRNIEFYMYVFSGVCLGGYRSELPQLMLQDLGIHHFDLIRYLSGQECQSIYARSWSANEEGIDIPATTNTYAILEMTGPVTASYAAKIRAITEPTGYSCDLVVTGSKGELTVKSGALTLQTFERHNAKKEPQQIELAPPELDTWQAFAEAIKTRQPTLTASGDNLKSLEVLFAAIESVEQGKLVSLNGQ